MSDNKSGHVWYVCQNLPGVNYAHDVPGSCQFCDGGLSLCTVCNGFEGTLTTKCPGVKISQPDQELIYHHYLDFNGEWDRKPKDSWDRRPDSEIKFTATLVAALRLNAARKG